MPLITTKAVNNITDASAEISANITSDGGTTITERGICWSRSNPSPTIEAPNHTAKNMDDLADFTKTLDNLNPFDTYYVRAYATNSVGISYGEVLTFKTLAGTLKDNDDNTYHTITIGDQVWMQENWKCPFFTNGDVIPYLSANWETTTTPALCLYNNDGANKSKYGILYNIYVVNTGNPNHKLAPDGWKIPTKDEWYTLREYLGGQAVAGGKMKDITAIANGGTWLGTNEGASNESGFTAVAAGFRISGFKYIGEEAAFLTATGDINSGWITYQIRKDDNTLFDYNSPLEGGYSVRLLRVAPANN